MNRELPSIPQELKEEIKTYKADKEKNYDKWCEATKMESKLFHSGMLCSQAHEEAFSEYNHDSDELNISRNALKQKILKVFKDSSYAKLMQDEINWERYITGKKDGTNELDDYGIASTLMDLEPKVTGFFGPYAAWKEFWPDGEGHAACGWHLHHRNPTLNKTDKERYKKYMLSDLVMLTINTHRKLHRCLIRLKTLFIDNLIDKDTANQIVRKLTSITDEEDARKAVNESTKLIDSCLDESIKNACEEVDITIDDI